MFNMGNSFHYNRNIKHNNIELKRNIGKIKIILRNIENNKILKKKMKNTNNYNISRGDYRDDIEYYNDINENTHHNNEIVSNIQPNVWQEFYDDSAEARYWYNVVTGEATWVKPENEIHSGLFFSSPKNRNRNKCIKKIKKKINYNKCGNKILQMKNKNMKVYIEPIPIYNSV